MAILLIKLVDYQSLQANLSERLETALGTCAPLLREVFIEFAPYLTQTLLGTKGQELLRGGKFKASSMRMDFPKFFPSERAMTKLLILQSGRHKHACGQSFMPYLTYILGFLPFTIAIPTSWFF